MAEPITNPFQEILDEFKPLQEIAQNMVSELSSNHSVIAAHKANENMKELLKPVADTVRQLQEITEPYVSQFRELQETIAEELPRLKLEDYQSLKIKCEGNLKSTLESLQSPNPNQTLEETCNKVEYCITDVVSVIGDKASKLWCTLVQHINSPMPPVEQRLAAYLPLLISIISFFME